MKIEKVITIKNPQGLHARPAAVLVQIANKYGVDVKLERNGMVVDGKSIMGILMLEAGKGTRVRVIVEGDLAEEAMKEIEEILENEREDK